MKKVLCYIICLMMSLVYCRAQNDVDSRIAVNSNTDDKTFVVIISNENYKHEENVPFAKNDGEVFNIYCQKTLGIPKSNIRFVADATLNEMNYEIDWLTDVLNAYDREARAIIYYTGHGMPDENSKEAYLLPVDGYSESPASALSTKALYDKLRKMESNRIMVFLDACFSGAKRDGKMLSSSRGVKIKAQVDPVGDNTVVFSAAQGDETAYPYKSKNHGMFTYYILEKLQQSGGCTTLGELSAYVTKEVKRKSIVENGKSQTPSVVVATGNTNWRNWRFAPSPAKKFETRTTANNVRVSTPTESQSAPSKTNTNSGFRQSPVNNNTTIRTQTSSTPVQTTAAASVDNSALNNLVEQGKKAMRAMNYETAKKYFIQAANQGSIEGFYQLGMLYSNSNYDGYHRQTATSYFLKAANANHVEAMYQTGMMYLGTDNATAKQWLRKASDKGHQRAQAQLSKLR